MQYASYVNCKRAINSKGYTDLSPPIFRFSNHCQKIGPVEYQSWKVTVRELTKLIGRPSSTAVAVFSTPHQYCKLQNEVQFNTNLSKEK